MKFRLHPILLPFFLYLIVTGNLSTYTIILFSLLFHEAGHLVAAYLMGMRVRSCTILPYGGELVIPRRDFERRRNRIILALSGPAATGMLLVFALIFSFPGDKQVFKIQLILLGLNLLPILPLDGGHALTAVLETKGAENGTKTLMLIHSMVFLSAGFIILSFFYPGTLPYLLLTLFLFIQNITMFRFRRYDRAIKNIQINRLTK